MCVWANKLNLSFLVISGYSTPSFAHTLWPGEKKKKFFFFPKTAQCMLMIQIFFSPLHPIPPTLRRRQCVRATRRECEDTRKPLICKFLTTFEKKRRKGTQPPVQDSSSKPLTQNYHLGNFHFAKEFLWLFLPIYDSSERGVREDETSSNVWCEKHERRIWVRLDGRNGTHLCFWAFHWSGH